MMPVRRQRDITTVGGEDRGAVSSSGQFLECIDCNYMYCK